MMISKPILLVSLSSLLFLGGCGEPEEEALLPDQVVDFDQLFESNCSGCHGKDGHGAAPQLNDPVYQAVVPKDQVRNVIANGRAGTPMPAFAKSAGGMLTDQQVQILVDGMQKKWGKPEQFTGVLMPPYSSTGAGDVQRGEAVFKKQCAACHGVDGRGGKVAGSLVDASFLALASDQLIRTTVIVGRRIYGMPDWRRSPGTPLQAQEISDVVAWVLSHRPPSLSASVPTQKGATQP